MSIKSYFLSKISKDSSEENTGASDSKKQPEAKGAGTSGKKRKAADADTETVMCLHEVASTLPCATMNASLPPPLQFSNSRLKSEQ